MWHLILPPFIIISGIGVLLWFLSRRMSDPSFLSRLPSAQGEVGAISRSRALSRKAFFLKLLEKTASKSKTGSLRIHNFFQSSLERLREKRRVIDELRRETKESSVSTEDNPADQSSERGKGRSRALRWFRFRRNESVSEDLSVVSEEVTPSLPIETDPDSAKQDDVQVGDASGPEREISRTFGIFRKRRSLADADVKKTAEEEVSSRLAGELSETVPLEPVLKKTVAHPDRESRRIQEKNPREEQLIASIAENPRDTTAYEELGDLYLAARNMQDAKACYRQVLKLHPTNRAVKLKIRKVERFFEKNVP